MKLIIGIYLYIMKFYDWVVASLPGAPDAIRGALSDLMGPPLDPTDEELFDATSEDYL